MNWKSQLILIRRQEAFCFSQAIACWLTGSSYFTVHVLNVLLMCWTVVPRIQGKCMWKFCSWAIRSDMFSMHKLSGTSDQDNLLLVAPLEESVMNKHARACPMGIICTKMLEHGCSQSQIQPGHSYICQLDSYTVTIVIHTLSSFCPFSLVLCTPETIFWSTYDDGFGWGV